MMFQDELLLNIIIVNNRRATLKARFTFCFNMKEKGGWVVFQCHEEYGPDDVIVAYSQQLN